MESYAFQIVNNSISLNTVFLLKVSPKLLLNLSVIVSIFDEEFKISTKLFNLSYPPTRTIFLF